MIMLDIETTGLQNTCGIWQIGAVNLRDPKGYFFQEAGLDEDDFIQPEAMTVHGKTEEELRRGDRQKQSSLIENYLEWVKSQPEKMFFGQNVGWDISMIQSRTIKYGFHRDFIHFHGQRGNDLHTLAQEKHFQIYGIYCLNDIGRSAMHFKRILEFCGLKDERTLHNALEDCKLGGETLYRIKFGRNFFEEFERFAIPEYLKNDNLQ